MNIVKGKEILNKSEVKNQIGYLSVNLSPEQWKLVKSNKLKDYKISDYLLLLLTIIAVVNMIEAVIISYPQYMDLVTNAVDENYMNYLLESVSPTMLRGVLPFVLVIPLFNYLMVRRYYNMELTMQDRILDSKFKIKEDERTILDKEVIDSNSKFEYKPNYFRLGVNKNLDEVHYNESSQNAIIFRTTGTGLIQ